MRFKIARHLKVIFNILLCFVCFWLSPSWVFAEVTTIEVIQSKDKTDVPVYRFGVVPQFEQRKLFKIWSPILNELERITGLKFQLRGSSKIPEFEERFMSGGFDFAYMNPYHLVKANSSQGYVPLIRDNSRSLSGVLVVRKDSPIKTIADLHNKTIAFPAPNALGASLLMRSELHRNHGIEFTPKYVQTHSSVYLHVAKRLVEAGGGVKQTLDLQRDVIKDNLEVIYTTQFTNPHPVVSHPRVSLKHQKLVQQAFLEIEKDNRSRLFLRKVPMGNAVIATMNDYQNIIDWDLDSYYVP